MLLTNELLETVQQLARRLGWGTKPSLFQKWRAILR